MGVPGATVFISSAFFPSWDELGSATTESTAANTPVFTTVIRSESVATDSATSTGTNTYASTAISTISDEHFPGAAVFFFLFSFYFFVGPLAPLSWADLATSPLGPNLWPAPDHVLLLQAAGGRLAGSLRA